MCVFDHPTEIFILFFQVDGWSIMDSISIVCLVWERPKRGVWQNACKHCKGCNRKLLYPSFCCNDTETGYRVGTPYRGEQIIRYIEYYSNTWGPILQGVSKKLSFSKLSFWRSCFQMGRNTYDICDKSGNAQFGKTQFF